MAQKSRSQKAAPRSCRDCENWATVSKKVRVTELVEKAIAKFDAKIKKAGFEPTVAEYVKLLQLGQELGQEDDPKEIKVEWIDSPASTEA